QALRLAQLSEKTYLSFQQKWIGSKEAACNFFLITSLCESGYCKNDKPFYRAADFDTYFRETGWAEVTLGEAKKFLQNNSEIDLVAQRGSSTPSGMGHVAVPFRVGSQNDLIVAQGNYHESSHEVENWDDRFAQSFHYFVNFAPKVSRAFL
ncbi:MAG: hypothetical protein H7333_10615, partial [Bdellovibrionales bacterium]|nr:hypothetical protein [Oligoflexia bacterium]